MLLADTTTPTTPQVALFCAAAVRSLRPDQPADDLQQVISNHAGTIDRVWVSLARHIARCSTSEDRELLEHLARTAEHPDPIIARGLRFLVRGDVMFVDGTFVTLDELCDRAGVEHLPYLEEMPDELEF